MSGSVDGVTYLLMFGPCHPLAGADFEELLFQFLLLKETCSFLMHVRGGPAEKGLNYIVLKFRLLKRLLLQWALVFWHGRICEQCVFRPRVARQHMF